MNIEVFMSITNALSLFADRGWAKQNINSMRVQATDISLKSYGETYIDA